MNHILPTFVNSDARRCSSPDSTPYSMDRLSGRGRGPASYPFWGNKNAPAAMRRRILRSAQQWPLKRSFSTLECSNRVESTRKWVEAVVLGEKLCPFAPQKDAPQLRIVASSAVSIAQALHDVSLEVRSVLDEDSPHETTLITFLDTPFTSDFRDFVRFSWEIQSNCIGTDYQELLQLVLFHPQATHQTYGQPAGDASPGDYSIRSPYPVVHLLREIDVLRAVQGNFPDLEGLPARNKQKLRRQGLEVCRKRLETCIRAKRHE